MGVLDDAASTLVAEELAGGDTGWRIARRNPKLQDDRLVTLTEEPGPAPEQVAATGMGDAASGVSGLQVRVRAEAFKSDVAQAKATEILQHFHALPAGPTIGSTVYEGVWSMTSLPAFMGFDEKNRPEFTVSLRFMSPVPVP